MALRALLTALLIVASSGRGRAQDAGLVGIDCSYALDMAKREKGWKDRPEPVDPWTLFANNGCRIARIRLWVGDDGINRLNYATQTAVSNGHFSSARPAIPPLPSSAVNSRIGIMQPRAIL
jgi:hypothetical protein